MDIGTLTGQIALEDQLSSQLTVIGDRVKKFAQNFDGVMGAAAISAGVLTAAVGGAIVTITELGKKGSEILGVEQAFDRLAKAAGSSGEALLGGLNEGVKNTLDSMVLMESTTRLLSSGIKLSADDMRIMGATAREMGKATGTDAADGLNTLSSSLLTGNTRLLRRYGIQIDVTQAERTFAASVGTTRDQLNQAGKVEAARIAMLEAMRVKLNTLGTSEIDFKERVQQTAVWLGNQTDELAKSVAASPNVMRAYNAIATALTDAFGGDSQNMLKTVVGWINRFADAVTRYGPPIIRMIADVAHGVLDIWHNVQKAWSLVPDWFKNLAKEAGVAAGAVYLTKTALVGIGGPDLLGTAASLATLTSGLRDFTQIMIGAVPKAITYAKSMIATLALTYQLGGIAAIWEGITVAIAGFAATTTGIAVLTAGAIFALYKFGQAIKQLYDIWQSGKPMWSYFQQGGGFWDNSIIGRWLGMSKSSNTLATALDEQKDSLEALMKTRSSSGYKPQAAEATTPPSYISNNNDEHLKSVKELLKSLRGDSEELKVLNDAFKQLSSAELATYDVQQRLLPQLDKLIDAHKKLSTEQLAAYNAALTAQQAHIEQEKALLSTTEITLGLVDALKERGLSEKNIAAQYGVSSEGLQAYLDDLKEYGGLVKEVTDADAARQQEQYQAGVELAAAQESFQAKAWASYTANQKKLLAATKTGVAAQLDVIEESAEQQIEALGTAPEGAQEAWRAAVDKIREIQRQQVRDVYIDNEALKNNSKRAHQEIADKARATYLAMAADSDNYSKATIQHFKDVSDAAQEAVDGQTLGGSLKQGLIGALAEIPDILTDALVNGATLEDTGKAIGATVGGAIGMAIGSFFGGPLGAAIGAAAGAGLGSAFAEGFRTDGEDVVRRVGKDWGIAISEEMGNAIAQSAHDLFPTGGGEGNLAAAEIYALGDLMSLAGVDTDNIDMFTSKLRDAFSMLETGTFTAAQTTRVLNESFGELAAQFEGGVISKGLREIIRLTQQAGLESKAITDFLQAQASRARSGLEGIVAGALSRDENKSLFPVSQEEFERLSRITTATFGAAIAAGEPFLQTLLSMNDSIGSLNEAAVRFGYAQSEAFGDLTALQNFFATNEGLGQSIQGTNELLQALANSNLLTQQTFTDLGATAVANFEEMTAGGLTANQAMLAQQDTLQTLWELAAEGTLVLDEQTASLVDQAVEAGLVGNAHMDAQERATAAMERAALAMERVGTAMETAFGLAGDSSITFADTALDQIARLPKEVQFTYRGIYVAPGDSVGEAVPMAEGGAGTVTSPTLFLAGEAGPEQYAFSGANRTFGGGNSDEVAREMRLLRAEMKSYERGQRRAIRDELLTAPRR